MELDCDWPVDVLAVNVDAKGPHGDLLRVAPGVRHAPVDAPLERADARHLARASAKRAPELR